MNTKYAATVLVHTNTGHAIALPATQAVYDVLELAVPVRFNEYSSRPTYRVADDDDGAPKIELMFSREIEGLEPEPEPEPEMLTVSSRILASDDPTWHHA